VLEYRAAPDVLTYASAAKGFREGGNNPALPQGPPPQGCNQDLANIGRTPSQVIGFQPDTLWSYELGAKSSFLDRRFTANAAAFLIEWSDIQQQVALPLCGYFITGNSGKAQSTGFELEFNGRLLPGLTLGIGLGYVDAHIVEKGVGSAQAVGSPVYQVPNLTLSGNLEYQWPLRANWAPFGRIDYSYIGESFSANNGAVHPLRRPSYEIADLRLGVRHDRFEIAAFVTNLTNEHASLADAVLIGAQLPGQPRVLINQPRTVGIDVRIRFD
jgi:outer membrane receptor protein involved in Fe transport